MSERIFLGLDLGTSSLKGVAATAEGDVLAEAASAYPTLRKAPGQAEQQPVHWWHACEEVVGRLREGLGEDEPGGIGLSAMIPTLVPAAADGTPLGPAITWEDSRAAAEGEAFRKAAGAAFGDATEGLYTRTGQWVDGRYLLPMWERWREEADAPRDARPLAAKDHLFRQLTGMLATDPSTATGYGIFDLQTGTWLSGDARLEAQGLSPLPELPQVSPSDTLRPLAHDPARTLRLPAGLPVCLGAADSVLAALALAAQPGDVAYVTGTSTVILGVAGTPRSDAAHRYLVTPLAAGDGWGLEMDLVSTGSAVQWLSRLLGLGDAGQDELLRLAGEAPDDDELQMAPFLGGGEQGALWDDVLRGTIVGLDLSSTPAGLARAMVAGMVLESRRCLDVLAGAGVTGPIRAAGPVARSPFLRRQLADATGREVLFSGVPSPSAIGAALLAARAAGDVRQNETWPLPLERTAPDPAAKTMWDERWRRHEALVTQLQQLYRTAR